MQHPDVTFNTGFSDLGRGFYLTDDFDAACGRARSRARRVSADSGVVSVYEFDESAVGWITIGGLENGSEGCSGEPGALFGLRFEPTRAGLVAWANYIKSCRRGHTAVEGRGEPAIVRAWIATEEVEMACSGFAPAEALAEFIEPADLVVQYCFRSQAAIDAHLSFAAAHLTPGV